MTAIATAPGDALQPADAFVQRALDTIHEFSYRDMSVPHLAQQLGVTPRTLQRRFAEARGRTVSEEISQSRVERARRLLRETRMSVKQVAFASGFTSPDRMTKVFRRLTGKTPSAYRASLAKNTAPRLQPE